MHPSRARLTAFERRATASLAGVSGLRLLGMFIILPVFALYAERLPGGDNQALVGLAIGIYGLTQALFQLPFGWLSDRVGRKPVIYAGLALLAFGSFVAAAADNIYWVIVGRVLQGAGAISAAVVALLADLTRDEHRTQAMAVIGITIGVAFMVSLVAAPILDRFIGVPGIFALTGALALAAMAVVAFVVPDPERSAFHVDAGANVAMIAAVVRDPDLLRLDVGAFVLHAVLTALWVVVPFQLREAGLETAHHWWVYLPVMVASIAFIVPAIIYAERRAKLKPVFLAAIVVLAAGEVALFQAGAALSWLVLGLLGFFIGFNLLEAMLPSLISKMAPVRAKGTAIGVYSSVQFFGTFVGGVAGGWLAQHYGAYAVFAFCVILLLAWLGLAAGMRPPPSVRTHVYPIPEMDAQRARGLAEQLSRLPGVREAMVIAGERVAYIKADAAGFDEQRVLQLLGGRA
ncbi:MAG TPA: MFS transporter [Pelomicrobium sp.]|nr:MFS transporter [Pelomicrobium sp.]